MGAKVSEMFLSGSMLLEVDVRNIAEDIAASTVPLAEWKPLKVNPTTERTVVPLGSNYLPSLV